MIMWDPKKPMLNGLFDYGEYMGNDWSGYDYGTPDYSSWSDWMGDYTTNYGDTPTYDTNESRFVDQWNNYLGAGGVPGSNVVGGGGGSGILGQIGKYLGLTNDDGSMNWGKLLGMGAMGVAGLGIGALGDQLGKKKVEPNPYQTKMFNMASKATQGALDKTQGWLPYTQGQQQLQDYYTKNLQETGYMPQDAAANNMIQTMLGGTAAMNKLFPSGLDVIGGGKNVPVLGGGGGGGSSGGGGYVAVNPAWQGSINQAIARSAPQSNLGAAKLTDMMNMTGRRLLGPEAIDYMEQSRLEFDRALSSEKKRWDKQALPELASRYGVTRSQVLAADATMTAELTRRSAEHKMGIAQQYANASQQAAQIAQTAAGAMRNQADATSQLMAEKAKMMLQGAITDANNGTQSMLHAASLASSNNAAAYQYALGLAQIASSERGQNINAALKVLDPTIYAAYNPLSNSAIAATFAKLGMTNETMYNKWKDTYDGLQKLTATSAGLPNIVQEPSAINQMLSNLSKGFMTQLGMPSLGQTGMAGALSSGLLGMSGMDPMTMMLLSQMSKNKG